MEAQVQAPEAFGEETRAAIDARARTPFQTVAYAASMRAAGGEALIVHAAGGHVPVLVSRMLEFRTWVALAPPVADDAPAFWRALLAAAKREGALSIAWREHGTIRLRPADLAAAKDAAAGLGAELVEGALATYALDLTLGEERLLARMDRKHRHALRHAAPARVERVAGRAFVDAYAPLSDATFARSGAPGPARAYFDRIVQEPWARGYLARDADGQPVAGALVTLFGGEANYLHGATSSRAPGLGQALQWAIVRDLVEAGATRYDLGGVALPGGPGDTPKAQGIRRFKAGFGGAAEAWPSLQARVDPAGYRAAQEKVRAAMAAPR